MSRRSQWRTLTAIFAGAFVSTLVACGGGSSSSSSSRLAYVAGGPTNVIGLRISSTGSAQTILGSPFVTGNGPSSVVVHPSNKFLFVSNQGEGTISLFTIDATSGATALGQSPSGVTLTAAGDFLYVPVPNFSAVYAFAVSSGTLTPVGSPFVVSGGVATVAVDPAGKFLFVPNPSNGTVTVLTIMSGALSTGAGAFAASTSPVAAATDLSGKYLYVANFGSTTVSQYTIDSTTGALTAFTSSTSTPTAGTNASFVLPDPNGKLVYIGNQGSSSISEFTIKSDGSLTSTSNSITLGVQPRSLAVTK